MGRAPCCDKANVKKGPWSPEEDAKLKSYIELHGTGGNWIALPQKIGLKRCGKSCRLRWLNYLRPNIKHGGFSEEEDNLICSLYATIGSRWSIIASQLPGRTDNDIKNYWNTRLRKKLLGKQRKDHQQQQARPKPLMMKNDAQNLVTQNPTWQVQQYHDHNNHGNLQNNHQLYSHTIPSHTINSGYYPSLVQLEQQLYSGSINSSGLVNNSSGSSSCDQSSSNIFDGFESFPDDYNWSDLVSSVSPQQQQQQEVKGQICNSTSWGDITSHLQVYSSPMVVSGGFEAVQQGITPHDISCFQEPAYFGVQ